MNILSIEKARNELISFLENTGSRRLKAKRISEFFAILIEQKSFSLIESYVLEFIPKYLDCLKNFSPFGASPEFTQNIIQLNDILIETNAAAEYKERLTHLNFEIQAKLHSLNRILAGEQFEFQDDRKAFFPLIEDGESKNITQTIGAIDSITIKISKAKQKDKFILVPSETENDKQLEEQINICWDKAKTFCKKYIKKLSVFHEVIISFDGNLGIYRGESLGAALTIAMIEELLRHYNSQTVLQPISNVAFTGGISEGGKVNKVSKEIVEKKVEIAFYSNCQTLAIPKEDETFALYKLDELYKLYPKRNLRLVGVSDLAEILLRRDLVEIKKQKIIVRTGKFIKKNWVSAVVTVLLAVLFGYLFVVDWDDNPSLFSISSNTLFVKNKNNKVLWTKRVETFSDEKISANELHAYQKIIDINNDGINELLLCGELFDQTDSGYGYSPIICYDYKGERIWKYDFEDVFISANDTLKPSYKVKMIDTATIKSIKQIVCVAANLDSYASAVFKLDVRNGNRLDGTLWNDGHIVGGIIGDFNSDSKKELAINFFNNSFHQTGISVIDVEKISGMMPCKIERSAEGISSANLYCYILVPNTDYSELWGDFSTNPGNGTILKDENEKVIMWETREGRDSIPAGIGYKLSYNFKDIIIVVSSVFASKRDNCVKNGILAFPLSDTQEYRNLLLSKILNWKNGKWVRREELE